MRRLNPSQIKARRQGEFSVLAQMESDAFQFNAYRSVPDLMADRNPITNVADATEASAFELFFNIPTLIGPGVFRDTTCIGANIAVEGYPVTEPATFLLDSDVVYSPHFAPGRPVCLGSMWTSRKGNVLLGHLVVHLARLLNWDERARSGGYQGWNGEAIEYHRRTYGASQLNPNIVYPVIPASIYGIEDEPSSFTFTPTNPSSPFDDFTFRAS